MHYNAIMTTTPTKDAAVPASVQHRTSSIGLVSAIAALGGILFGYDTGVMSGALLFIKPDFDMSATQEGVITSILMIGAALGALSGGRLADAIGRRWAVFWAGILFIVASLACAFSGGTSAAAATVCLSISRFFLGVAVGGASIIVPMYISEIAPQGVRGRLATLNSLMIVVGQLIAYGVNSAFAPSENWRLMLGLGVVPAVVLAIGTYFLPDSPVYYLLQDRPDDAAAVLRHLRRGDDAAHIDEELASLAAAVAEKKNKKSEWSALGTPWIKTVMGIAIVVAMIQQVTGVNAIVYYAPTMLKNVGWTSQNAVFGSILIGVVSVISCWVGLSIVDKVGRRPLLLGGLAGTAVSLVALTLVYWLAPTDELWVSSLMLALMGVFMVFQQSAVSVATWLLVSELIPSAVRGIGMGIAGLALWLMNFVVAMCFPPLLESIGGAWTFFVFAVLCVLSFVFVDKVIPETKNRSLPDIEEEFRLRYAEK